MGRGQFGDGDGQVEMSDFAQEFTDQMDQYVDRLDDLFEPGKHTRMFIVVSFLATIVVILGQALQSQIVGYDARSSYDDRYSNTRYYVGLWTVDHQISGNGTSVCGDWPPVIDASVCNHVKGARAMLILGTIMLVITFVGAVLRHKRVYLDDNGSFQSISPERIRRARTDQSRQTRMNLPPLFWPIPVIYTFIASAILNCIGYALWQSGAHDSLERALKVSLQGDLGQDYFSKGGKDYYYSTLGTAYGLVLFSWVWLICVLLVKFLPYLDTDPNDDKEL